MVREVSPVGLGSTASAAHLCIRNLVGGLGPIAVAILSAKARRECVGGGTAPGCAWVRSNGGVLSAPCGQPSNALPCRCAA
jgi:hypothetical protein